jgi:hypothetical protein
MSHWYRPPRAASVGYLLRRLPKDFLVDERVSDRVLPLLIGKVRIARYWVWIAIRPAKMSFDGASGSS